MIDAARRASRGGSPALVLALVASFAGAIALQRVRADWIDDPAAAVESRLLYLPSGEVVKRVALAYPAVLADVYWIRALQHFGSTRRSADPEKRYDLLYPLLDITTTLDPRFTIAYRFGAIFLAEPWPGGPGRPDQAIALLRKGLRADPYRWQYMQDIGFIHYWSLHDMAGAARWFHRASQVPGAPWWLQSLEADTLASGGDRQSSRRLWELIHQDADHEWIRQDAARRLAQLDALDQIDRWQRILDGYRGITGHDPVDWNDLAASEGLTAVPRDPAGVPYEIDHHSGSVRLSVESPLHPLPTEPRPAPPGS
jgi:hypothetical protein